MKILIKNEHDDRKKDKQLNVNVMEKEIKNNEKKMDNLVDALSETTSSITRQKLENKVEELEMVNLKLKDKVKSLKVNKEIIQVLDLAFEILSNPYYVWQK